MIIVPTVSAVQPLPPVAPHPSIPVVDSPLTLMATVGGAAFAIFKMLLDREQRRLDRAIEALNKSSERSLEMMAKHQEEQLRLLMEVLKGKRGW